MHDSSARWGVAAVAVAVGLGSLLVPQRTSAAPGLTITVVNDNPDFPNEQVFVMAQAGGTELTADPQPLSARDSFTVSSITSGRVFVSLGEPLPAEGEPSPDTSPVRYDTVELTYPGVANLTAVDMFGIPLDLEVFDADGHLTGAKRWGCYTDVVRDTLSDTLMAAGGDPGRAVRTDRTGRFLRLVSPNIVSGLHPSGYPRFDGYLASLSGVPLTVRGTALGRSYHYVGAFHPDRNDPDGPGTLTLVDSGPDELLPIEVSGRSLVGNSGNATNGIYGNNSPYLVGGEEHSGNDVYAAAYRDLVAGFAYGFWGNGAYGNDSARFDVAAAPGPFAAAQPHSPHYNVWAAALWPLTDAYGFPYGDTFNDSPERNPIVELPVDGTLRITIQPDISPASCTGDGAPTPTPSVSLPATPAAPQNPAPAESPTPTSAPGADPRSALPARPGRPRVTAHRKRVRIVWAPPEGTTGDALQFAAQAKVTGHCRILGRTTSTALTTRLRKEWRGRSVAFRVVARNEVSAGPASRVARHTFPRRSDSQSPLSPEERGRPCSAEWWRAPTLRQ